MYFFRRGKTRRVTITALGGYSAGGGDDHISVFVLEGVLVVSAVGATEVGGLGVSKGVYFPQ